MKKKHRLIPSVLYIVMIIITIVIAVATLIKGLVLLCVVILTACYYWYTISFIPFGTKILKKLCGACFDIE
jgi:predicted membrane channel-forming protein YqfA (hemolysin III family)